MRSGRLVFIFSLTRLKKWAVEPIQTFVVDRHEPKRALLVPNIFVQPGKFCTLLTVVLGGISHF